MVSFKSLAIMAFIAGFTGVVEALEGCAAPVPTHKCNADNLLRLFRNTKYAYQAATFCAEYISTTLTTTITVPAYETWYAGTTTTVIYKRDAQPVYGGAVAYPTWLPETYPPSRVTSACKCISIPVISSTVYATHYTTQTTIHTVSSKSTTAPYYHEPEPEPTRTSHSLPHYGTTSRHEEPGYTTTTSSSIPPYEEPGYTRTSSTTPYPDPELYTSSTTSSTSSSTITSSTTSSSSTASSATISTSTTTSGPTTTTSSTTTTTSSATTTTTSSTTSTTSSTTTTTTVTTTSSRAAGPTCHPAGLSPATGYNFHFTSAEAVSEWTASGSLDTVQQEYVEGDINPTALQVTWLSTPGNVAITFVRSVSMVPNAQYIIALRSLQSSADGVSIGLRVNAGNQVTEIVSAVAGSWKTSQFTFTPREPYATITLTATAVSGQLPHIILDALEIRPVAPISLPGLGSPITIIDNRAGLLRYPLNEYMDGLAELFDYPRGVIGVATDGYMGMKARELEFRGSTGAGPVMYHVAGSMSSWPAPPNTSGWVIKTRAKAVDSNRCVINFMDSQNVQTNYALIVGCPDEWQEFTFHKFENSISGYIAIQIACLDAGQTVLLDDVYAYPVVD